MNKKCYSNTIIAGLRTNSKLCTVSRLRGPNVVMVYCGLGCQCGVLLPDYGGSIKAAKEAVMKKHDQWLETDKRNRKREGDTRFGPVEAPRIRRSPWGVPRTSAVATARPRAREAHDALFQAQDIRLNPSP